MLPEIPLGAPGCESKLTELHLGRNKLVTLPTSIQALESLAVLDVGDNNLKEIPAEIQACKALRLLDLRNNELGALPPQLCKCPALNKLVLDGNPMRFIRRNIIEQGTFAIIDFLRSRLPEGELEVDVVFDPSAIDVVLREAHGKGVLELANRGLSTLPSEIFNGDLRIEGLHKVGSSLTSA